MKIAFYLDNSSLKEVDMREPDKGNPGIGGTQFMILSIAYYLKNKFKDIEVNIFAPNISLLPSNLTSVQCCTTLESIYLSNKFNIDVLILRSEKNNKLYKLIDKLKVKTIVWAHNFSSRKELSQIARTFYVKRYICVGKTQYDMLIDHEIINKAKYIYNCLDFNLYNKGETEKENIICYIGSIIPSKGFHVLAEAWPKIKKEVPNAKLYIVGSGKLYNRNEKLGEFGIASEKYEEKFIRYLVNKSNSIDKDIKICGVLGQEEKLKIINKSSVGVANPTAKTETFCISAIEFEALGVPVVTRAKNGFLDTVADRKSGLLFKNKKDFSKYIIKLLKDEKLNNKLGREGIEFVKNKFNINDIVDIWKNEINEVIEDMEVQKDFQLDDDNIPILVKFNYKVKKIKLFKILPAICEYKLYLVDFGKFILRR